MKKTGYKEKSARLILPVEKLGLQRQRNFFSFVLSGLRMYCFLTNIKV